MALVSRQCDENDGMGVMELWLHGVAAWMSWDCNGVVEQNNWFKNSWCCDERNTCMCTRVTAKFGADAR